MLESAQTILPNTSSEFSAFAASPDQVCRLVVSCVAFDFGLEPALLETAPRGSQRAAHARQIAMYLAHVTFGLSFEIIAHLFGRDRTTVAYACRVVEDGRDDIWFDCRVSPLELMCLAASGGTPR